MTIWKVYCFLIFWRPWCFGYRKNLIYQCGDHTVSYHVVLLVQRDSYTVLSIQYYYIISFLITTFLRFNTENRHKMINILKNLDDQGVHWFIRSESLRDCLGLHFKDNRSLLSEYTNPINGISSIRDMKIHPIKILYNYIHHSRTALSRSFISLLLSYACQEVPKTIKSQLTK